MFWLLFLGLIIWLIVLASRPKNQNMPVNDTASQLEARNVEWAQFIAQYHDKAKTKAERQLIEVMLADIAAKGLPAPVIGERLRQSHKLAKTDLMQPVAKAYKPEYIQNIGPAQAAAKSEPVVSISERPNEQIQLDNASLLLYFGAFLFVAAVGLFVAFGGLPGTIRTFAVLFVAAAMYGMGIWLFRTKPKLEQAGLAFAGIGIAAAPFVGLAAYNFIFDQSSAPVVWFVTSVLCLGMYAHALVALRKPILNYILLFTVLSLVESGISVINAPIYYFGWGLSLTGLAFALFARSKKFDVSLGDSARQSSQLFVPLAVAASLLMVPQEGITQLGVSLLLASLFYLFDAYYGRIENRITNAVAVQVLATGGVMALVYGFTDSAVAVAAGLCVITSVTIVAALAPKLDTELLQNTATISAVTLIVATILAVSSPIALTTAIGLMFVQMILLWARRYRDDAFILAMIAWFALPMVAGQYLISPHISAAMQTGYLGASLIAAWGLIFVAQRHRSGDWLITAKTLYVLAGLLVIGWASFTGDALLFIVCGLIAISVVLLAERDKLSDWTSFAGAYLLVPVLLHDTPGWFLIATLAALAANIAISLRYRQEFSRWLSTGLWLLLPIPVAEFATGWSKSYYVFAYLLVMATLILSRAIARGVVLPSSKVALASYARSASISYVVGYVAAAAASLGVALSISDGQVVIASTLSVLLLTTLLLARMVEKQPEIYIGVPLLLQALLFVVMLPSSEPTSLNVYLLISTIISAVGYGAALLLRSEKHTVAWSAVQDSSLMMALLPAASAVVVGKTELMMPIGLLVFTAMLYHRLRTTSQSNREWIGGLGLLSVWWFMYYLGVTNIQAYTHVLAVLFAGYAYLRHVRGDKATSDSYLYAMLATATVPLILQALGGAAGDLYGWWLLLEQVAFILLGMAIGRPFVTRWGLYVAVGAVLYQLRGLGWAALAVLAIFLIGLAVYRLQKQDIPAKDTDNSAGDQK